MQQISFALFNVSDDFPLMPYEDVYRRVKGYRNAYRTQEGDQHVLSVEWAEFSGGWNALAQRFRACAEHDEAFTQLVKEHGESPPIEPARYQQERELYEFFVTGLTAIECCCYGLYFIGAMAKPSVFDDDPGAISPGLTESRYRSRVGFPNDRITVILGALIQNPDYKAWKGVRNVLAHRSLPGRMFRAGVGSAASWGPTTWFEERHDVAAITIDQQTTASRRTWLASALTELVAAASELLRNQDWPAADI